MVTFAVEKDASAPSSGAPPGKAGVQMGVSIQQQQKQQELLRSAVQEITVPKEPPPEFEFVADPPSISAFDLDVVCIMINLLFSFKSPLNINVFKININLSSNVSTDDNCLSCFF